MLLKPSPVWCFTLYTVLDSKKWIMFFKDFSFFSKNVPPLKLNSVLCLCFPFISSHWIVSFLRVYLCHLSPTQWKKTDRRHTITTINGDECHKKHRKYHQKKTIPISIMINSRRLFRFFFFFWLILPEGLKVWVSDRDGWHLLPFDWPLSPEPLIYFPLLSSSAVALISQLMQFIIPHCHVIM